MFVSNWKSACPYLFLPRFYNNPGLPLIQAARMMIDSIIDEFAETAMDFGLIFYIVLSIAASLKLLSSPYLRVTSLGWGVAIWTLPFIGALMFMLTVVRVRKVEHDQAINHLIEAHAGAPCDHGAVERLGIEYNFLPYFQLEDSQFLKDDEFVDAVCQSIESATSRVWMTTFILSGSVKDRILQCLIDAHERGVDVCLLIDRVGSGLLLKPRNNPLELDLPFEVSIFHSSLFRSLLFVEKRLHSKIVLADNEAFIGSHNLRDEVLLKNKDSVHNISLRFTGSVVTQVEAVFMDLWKLNTGDDLAAYGEAEEGYEEGHEEKPGEHSESTHGQKAARIIFSDPIERSYNYNAYLGDLFCSATDRICIWMPYIIPSQAMRRSIIAASKMGLDVRILFPKKSDSALVDNAHALVLKEFVENGVACALSEGTFDHSKILVIDDIAIIGSTNLDFRSLYRNYEANIEVHDQEFTHSVLTMFDQVFDAAEFIDRHEIGQLSHMRNQLTSLIAALY